MAAVARCDLRLHSSSNLIPATPSLSPIPTFATGTNLKKLSESTGADGQKKASFKFFCPRSQPFRIIEDLYKRSACTRLKAVRVMLGPSNQQKNIFRDVILQFSCYIGLRLVFFPNGCSVQPIYGHAERGKKGLTVTYHRFILYSLWNEISINR